MDERYYIHVHRSGEIRNIDEGITFSNQNPQFMVICLSVTLIELQNTIFQKMGQQSNKQIT